MCFLSSRMESDWHGKAAAACAMIVTHKVYGEHLAVEINHVFSLERGGDVHVEGELRPVDAPWLSKRRREHGCRQLEVLKLLLEA